MISDKRRTNPRNIGNGYYIGTLSWAASPDLAECDMLKDMLIIYYVMIQFA